MAVEPPGQVGARVGVRVPRDPVGTLDRELGAIVQMAGVREAARHGRMPRDARRLCRGRSVCTLGVGAWIGYSSRNVRLGGSSGSGRASCATPRCLSADTGSTTLDPMTTAAAGIVRVANLRFLAASAANRRRREASSPVSNRGRSIAPPATASAPRLRGRSRNQGTSASNHSSPVATPCGEGLRAPRFVSFAILEAATSNPRSVPLTSRLVGQRTNNLARPRRP